MSVPVDFERRATLQLYGRRYGELKFAVAFTAGLKGDAAKVAHNWQTRPFRLNGADHGAGIFGRGVKRNPVVVLRASGLIGVDVDGEAGRDLVRQLVPQGLPPTVCVVSGRADGGHHGWYRPPSPSWSTSKVEFGEKGLTLSSDGYLLLPPARHGETGREYRFAPGRAPWEHEIATLPVEILTALDAHDHAIDEAERADDSAPVPEGGRHKHLRRLAGAMRRVGAGEDTIAAALLIENQRRCTPPQAEWAVRQLARDVVQRYAPGVRT